VYSPQTPLVPSFGCQPGYLRFILSLESSDFQATINKMPQLSTVKNAAQTIVKKDRLLNAMFAGTKSLAISFGRTFYAFWLQITGLLYVALTGSGIFYLIHEYRANHFADRAHFWVPAITTAVCFCFTIQSFMKAKRTLNRK
jgi:hypothetical protein